MIAIPFHIVACEEEQCQRPAKPGLGLFRAVGGLYVATGILKTVAT